MADNLLTPLWTGNTPKWDFSLASHLLRRAGFGGTMPEIDALVKAGPQKAVEQIVNYGTIKDDLPDVVFGEFTAPEITQGLAANPPAGRAGRANGPGGRAPLNQLLQTLTDPQKKAVQQIQNAGQRAKELEVRLWWLDRMIHTKRPLEEKMTLFWHGLLVSSSVSVKNTYLLYRQNQLYRKNATGNFRDLVQAVSQDPAMLIYLNNNQNVKAHPNENYARELMELFTLGIGNYTENDIKESARAFSGWSNQGDQFVFHPNQHDEGVKTFLGNTGNLNGTDIVNIIFKQAAAPRYLATRLLKFFAIDDPSDVIVGQLADVVKQSDFQIAPVLKTLFASRWFYSEEVMLRQIKSPVQLVVGAFRNLGVSMSQPQQVINALKIMGQEIFAAPTVKGWDGGRAWINTSTLFARYNLPAYLGTGKLPGNNKQAAPANAKDQYAEFDSGWRPDVDLAAGDAATTDGVVDLYLNKLLGFAIEARKRADLIQYMNGTGDSRPHLHDPTTAESDRRVRGLVQLMMSMAEYQLC